MRSAGERRFESAAFERDLPPWAIRATARAALFGAMVKSDGVRSAKAGAMVPLPRVVMWAIRTATEIGSTGRPEMATAAKPRYDLHPRRSGDVVRARRVMAVKKGLVIGVAVGGLLYVMWRRRRAAEAAPEAPAWEPAAPAAEQPVAAEPVADEEITEELDEQPPAEPDV